MLNQPQSENRRDQSTETPSAARIYCRRCGGSNPSDAKLCEKCDVKLDVGTEAAKCVECVAQLRTNARFCTQCGVSQRTFEPPVAWLLGRQLLATLKSTLVYTAFGTKIDARDWMDAKVYSFDKQASEEAQKKFDPDQPESTPVELVIAEPHQEESWKQKEEFWFDYISDTGDGMAATYSIAYLCLSNLWVKERWAAKPQSQTSTEELIKGRRTDGAITDTTSVELDHAVEPGDGELRQLPRGEFLLVGGDTCYHLSDYASLHIRFQTPFDWAYRDLEEDLKKVGKRIDNEEDRKTGKNRRPLFGIPGNHDYYDMLDGFRRQFRLPVHSRRENKVYADDDLTAAQLMSRGFKRLQQASYLALRLPFNWMLWGLDTEVGKIDERQRDFFMSVRGSTTPEKLIVATSAPTTVFGKSADRDDEKSSKAFYQLNLRRCFLPRNKWENDEKKKWEAKEGEVLDPRQIRLDISGDVHQYARYWGPTSRTAHLTRPGRPTVRAEESPNYASVVSGLGGAFHHPSTTYVDEVREQALYPPESESRDAVAAEIFNPIKVFRGGGVGVIGGVIALVLAFAAIAGDSSRPAIHNFLPFSTFGITSTERYELTVSPGLQTDYDLPGAGAQRPASQSTPLTTAMQPEKVKPFILWRRLGIASATWSPEFAETYASQSNVGRSSATEADCKENLPRFLWGKCAVTWAPDFKIGMMMLLATLGIIGLTFYETESTYELARKQDEVGQRARKDVPHDQKKVDVANNLKWALWVTFAWNIALGSIGILSIRPYRPFITPFGNSLWVLLTLVWAATSVLFSLRYSDWLFAEASKRKVGGSDWAITWGLSIAAVVSLAAGLWLFGKYNLTAYLVSDIVFVTVLIATLGFLIYVAVTKGGQHQRTKGKLAMILVGIWHWLLQLGVALFLIKKGTWLTLVLAVGAVFLSRWIGRWLMQKNRRWGLTIAWFLFGAVMLVLPWLIYRILYPASWHPWVKALFWPYNFEKPLGPFSSYEWWASLTGWYQLVPLGIACILGGFFSCVWVGWYFAVCLGFNGHNNEVGGASRIEKFKQFIRFRLRENDLTGYVIAVNEPQQEGNTLLPELVDVFQLVRTSVKASDSTR